MSLPSFGQTILRGLFTLATHALTDHTGIPGVGPPSGAAGGELAGTYPNPTVAATHSGSTHAGAAAAAVATHDGQADPHPGYRLESATIGTTDLANDAVTYAKFQNVTPARLLGRTTAGAGDAEEISVGAGLALSNGVLTPSDGILTATLTLTHAQILTLFTVPVALVAAPGAGKMLVVQRVVWILDTVAGAYTVVGAGQLKLGTQGLSSGTGGPALGPANGSLVAAQLTRTFAYAAVASAIAAIDNQPLMLSLSTADPTGGNAANTFAYKVWYTIENSVQPL